MLLNEYLHGKQNLFNVMDSESLPLLTGNEDSLLNLLITSYGDKTLYSKFEDLSINDLSEMITLIHKQHWLDLIAFNDSSIDKFASTSNTITETITETGNREKIDESVNKVSGYNSDDLIVNDGDNSTQNETNTGETIRTLTDSKTDYRTAFNSLSLSAKTNIIKILVKDISDFLTLSIY